MQSRSWEQDGQKRSKVEVLANDVTFLDNRSAADDGSGMVAGTASTSSSGASSTKKKDDVVIEDIDDQPINLDDIPF